MRRAKTRGSPMMAKSKYSASESMQGNLYQCHHALLLLLRRNRRLAQRPHVGREVR
jgi:hypothetical protein